MSRGLEGPQPQGRCQGRIVKGCGTHRPAMRGGSWQHEPRRVPVKERKNFCSNLVWSVR
jgi:hypothetical protein